MTTVTPHPAATIMLVRDGAAGLEVFMTVRHQAFDFAAGALVFPGGRVEDSDHAIAVHAGTMPATDDYRLSTGFRIAGIRETFEECGILLARPRGADRLIDAERLHAMTAAYKARVVADDARFAELLAAENLVPAIDLLVPFAHWITPAAQKKRFDTVFFLAAAPEDQIGGHDGTEAIDSVWITPQDAIEAAKSSRYKVLFPTYLNLMKLARQDRVTDALEAARRAKLVTVEPVMAAKQDGVREMHIPAEADYGGSVFAVDLPSAM